MGLLCVCFLLGGFALCEVFWLGGFVGGSDGGGFFFFLVVAWVVGLWWLWYGWLGGEFCGDCW